MGQSSEMEHAVQFSNVSSWLILVILVSGSLRPFHFVKSCISNVVGAGLSYVLLIVYAEPASVS